MRYQVVVLDEEMGSDLNIESISYQKHLAGNDSAEFQNLRIYFGLCENDILGSTFDDNYIQGTRTLVYETSSQIMSGVPDQWTTIILDSPYFYDSSEGNLIIEVTWDTCIDHHSFYVRSWDAGSIRAVGYTQTGAPTNPTGSLSSSLPRMMLTGTSGGELTTLTFGSVKSIW